MKVLQVVPNKGWAIHKVMRLIQPSPDVEIRYHFILDQGTKIDVTNIDVVDFGLWCNLPAYKTYYPSILTVHHIEHGNETEKIRRICLANPTIIVTTNPTTQKELKHFGIKAEIIPITVPPQEFRVGYIGYDIPVKRFDVIDEACKLAGVRCCGIRRERPEAILSDEQINEWLRTLNVFVVAATEEPSSLPALEALAVGTPVISTKIGMQPHSYGITWFDGSVDDLTEKINQMKPKQLISPREYSDRYIEAYKRAIKLWNRN